MKPGSFVGALEALAGECDATPLPDDPAELDRLLAATSRIVLWEFEGLADRIRAGLNGTPQPVPTKPAPQPKPPDPPKDPK